MKIACVGGGPAGLYFAISMKLRSPEHDLTLFERNRPDDTFGWGVVFSDIHQHVPDGIPVHVVFGKRVIFHGCCIPYDRFGNV